MTPSARTATRLLRRHPALRAPLWLVVSLWVGLALPLGLSVALTPETVEAGPFGVSIPCLYRRATGVECWTCGMTRAFAALGHGQWGRALEFNRAAPPLYAVTWLAWLGTSAWGFILISGSRRSRCGSGRS